MGRGEGAVPWREPSDVRKNATDARCWRDFARGNWCNAIDVRDFVIRNVTPYTGDKTVQVVGLLVASGAG